MFASRICLGSGRVSLARAGLNGSTRSVVCMSPYVLCPRRDLRCMSSTGNTHNRPISPHVTIYKFPLAAVSSIANRASAVALSATVLGVGVINAAGGDAAAVIQSIKCNAPVLMPVIKLGVGLPLTYHFIASLRHFYWDQTASGLTIEDSKRSSVAVMGASAVIGLMLAGYTIRK